MESQPSTWTAPDPKATAKETPSGEASGEARNPLPPVGIASVLTCCPCDPKPTLNVPNTRSISGLTC
ncbi:hypothetical protein CsSME_00029726 [Camellia sinensis var. sinensis]